MKRRDLLKMAALPFLPSMPSLPSPGKFFGWDYNPESIRNFVATHKNPFISQQDADIKGTGEGQKVFLHKALERVTARPYIPHDQKAPDCVSHAAALAVDALYAVQIALDRAPQKWVNFAATEPIYGGSRIEVGNIKAGGGSTGHWAAEWLQSYGVLLRKKYPGVDFSRYDAKLAVEYGNEGVPDHLEPLAKLHPVKKTAICKNYSELRDCLFNGSPVMVCSNVGFGRSNFTRDSEGFLTRSRMFPWYHAMCFLGFDDTYRRPGGLCFNSWGPTWVKGPTRGPQPKSTFWIDADTIDLMLRQGDSFAFSSYVGFPRTIIPPYVFH